MKNSALNQTSSIFFTSFLLTFFIFGGMFLFPTIGIDTEAIILDQEGLLKSWEGMGRIGLVLIKRLFFPFTYNSYLQNGLMIVTLALILSFLIKKFHLSPLVFSISFLAIPITYSQLYFQLQNFEVILAFLLLILAIYNYIHPRKPRYRFLILTSLTIGFASSVYQSLFFFAITFTAFCLYQKSEKNNFKSWLLNWIPIPLGLIFYKFINLIFNHTPASTYLGFHIGNKLSLLSLLLIITILGFIFYKGPKNWLNKLNLFLFLSSPFYLFILTGNLVFRSLFPSLPFVFAYLLQQEWQKRKLQKTILALNACLLALTWAIQYKEYQRYQTDIDLAKHIAHAIPEPSYRVQFIGKKEATASFPSPYEPMMTSFFSWDPIDNQIRSDHMLQLVGAKFRKSTREENQAAYQDYQTLPSYPDQGFIQVLEEEKVVLVHFK